MRDTLRPSNLVELVSVDPASNRFRFFAVEVRETDRGAELHRRWGRLGGEPRHRIERFASLADADAARRALLTRRTGRGYVPAEPAALARARRQMAAVRAQRRARGRQLAFPFAFEA